MSPKTCAGGAKYGSIELESHGSLEEAVAHNDKIEQRRICFDAYCNAFKRVDVLWCPPDPVAGAQVKTSKPFHIYKLKPTAELGTGYAYCVQ